MWDGEDRKLMGKEQGGLFMLSALPDFGTNIRNGHEERITAHKQTEELTQRYRRQTETSRRPNYEHLLKSKPISCILCYSNG